jgi:hypothetical protein
MMSLLSFANVYQPGIKQGSAGSGSRVIRRITADTGDKCHFPGRKSDLRARNAEEIIRDADVS